MENKNKSKEVSKYEYNDIYYIIETLKLFFILILIIIVVFIIFFNFASALDYGKELVQSQKPPPSCNYHHSLPTVTQKCKKNTTYLFKKNNINYELDYKPSTNYKNICKPLCNNTKQVQIVNPGSGYELPNPNLINYETKGNKYFLSNVIGNGSGMAISITVSNGIIKSINIVNQGNGYMRQDVIKINGGAENSSFELLKTKQDILTCSNDEYNVCSNDVSPATGCNNLPPMAVDIKSKVLYPQNVILNDQGIC